MKPNFFAGQYLDRRAELRTDPDWFTAARADEATIYLLARGTAHLLTFEPEARIAFADVKHPLVTRATEASAVLLGWFHGARCVLIETEGEAEDGLGAGARFEELRPLASILPTEDSGLLAYARALSVWRARHRFCGSCGARTRTRSAGHVLACSNELCGTESFPRIDPAIIVLVTDGERALLGRQASWPKGRYSTLAGFVEPGESLEDAVAREVYEESGVRIDEVTYQSSQPWPFPSSLMLGFFASATSTATRLVDSELEHAAWFSREDIRAGRPALPTSTSISFRLLECWFDAGSPVPLAALPNLATWETRRA